MTIAPGTRLGPYEITAPLAAGGMGEVFRGRDTRLGRDVAIKILPQDLARNEQFLARFEREAKTISSLNHPNICTLFDVGHEDGTHFLVMEMIEGESLADRLQKGALPIEQVLRYGAQVADALDRAHKQGIIHRDLKPANVMLTKTGAKLLDFGLARPASDSGIVHGLTEMPTQAKPLTLAYTSNESGRFEIYVQSFPTPGKKYQVTTTGGNEVYWTQQGRELVYSSLDGTFGAVPVTLGEGLQFGTPVRLFTPSRNEGIDVNSDGQRFLAVIPANAANAQSLTVVLNWAEGLKK